MSKADPNHQVPPELASSPVPSFEAIRSEPDESSELRRNQTVPIPVGLRVEVATHGLPSLPAEHLRSTDDMDEKLQTMRDVDDPLRPMHDGYAARRSRWPLMLALALVIVAAGVAFALLRTPGTARDVEARPELRLESAAQPALATADAERAVRDPAERADIKRATSASALPVNPSAIAPSAVPSEKPRVKSPTAESGKRDKNVKVRRSDESDPSELMFKPE